MPERNCNGVHLCTTVDRYQHRFDAALGNRVDQRRRVVAQALAENKERDCSIGIGEHGRTGRVQAFRGCDRRDVAALRCLLFDQCELEFAEPIAGAIDWSPRFQRYASTRPSVNGGSV